MTYRILEKILCLKEHLNLINTKSALTFLDYDPCYSARWTNPKLWSRVPPSWTHASVDTTTTNYISVTDILIDLGEIGSQILYWRKQTSNQRGLFTEHTLFYLQDPAKYK